MLLFEKYQGQGQKIMINHDYTGIASGSSRSAASFGNSNNRPVQNRGNAGGFNHTSPFDQGEIKSGILNLVQQLIALLQKGGKPDSKPQEAATLNLSATQESNLKQLLGFTNGSPVGVQLLDEDGDGQISVGDTAIVSGGITGGEILRHTLTEQDIQQLRGSTGQLPQDFLDNQAKWKTANGGAAQNVDYTTQSSCFCPPDYTRPMNISEQDGRIVSATYADEMGGTVPDYIRDSLFTIDERFEQLQEAYQSGAEQVDVSYDPTYGYPTSVFIDRSSLIADEEISYSIHDLNFT
ncbi:MAG: DUF6174 domain-containing protein [Thiolinea sp.]